MTNYESAMDAVQSRLEGTGLAASLAEMLTDAIQELIEAELTARIGAEPRERSLARSNQRNGHRPKTVSTPGWRSRAADPEGPPRVVLPRTA